jgi:uncharacterized protein (TIGR02145 family)
MNKEKNISKLSLLIMILFLVFVSSCEKDDNDSLSNNSTVLFNPDINYGTMTDQDGNLYKTVTIGTQTWMAENLRTTKYNDGTAIPNVIENDEWAVQTTGAYCTYNNTSNADTILAYGSLYNWHAVNSGLLAPEGWHVPTDADFWTLTEYLDRGILAGGKLKEIGTIHWQHPNDGATNETGFTALPGGKRSNDGDFNFIGLVGFWWSASVGIDDDAIFRTIFSNSSDVRWNSYQNKETGYSVRLVKD